MNNYTSIPCTTCGKLLKFGLKFCPGCGSAILHNSVVESKTTAHFDPGNFDSRPWREPCLIPKRKYKHADLSNIKPWRPIMRQPKARQIPPDLQQKREAMREMDLINRRNNAAGGKAGEGEDDDDDDDTEEEKERLKGVLHFDGIPFQKAMVYRNEGDFNRSKEEEGAPQVVNVAEKYYERVYPLGIYDAVWIVNQSVAVHVSLMERGVKLEANGVVLSCKRWMQVSATIDWAEEDGDGDEDEDSVGAAPLKGSMTDLFKDPAAAGGWVSGLLSPPRSGSVTPNSRSRRPTNASVDASTSLPAHKGNRKASTVRMAAAVLENGPSTTSQGHGHGHGHGEKFGEHGHPVGGDHSLRTRRLTAAKIGSVDAVTPVHGQGKGHGHGNQAPHDHNDHDPDHIHDGDTFHIDTEVLEHHHSLPPMSSSGKHTGRPGSRGVTPPRSREATRVEVRSKSAFVASPHEEVDENSPHHRSKSSSVASTACNTPPLVSPTNTSVAALFDRSGRRMSSYTSHSVVPTPSAGRTGNNSTGTGTSNVTPTVSATRATAREPEHVALVALPDTIGKNLLVDRSTWVELNAISPHEYYMAEFLQNVLTPLAYRVKPIYLTVPVVEDVDQITLVTSNVVSRPIPYTSSMFEPEGENILHITKLSATDVKVHPDTVMDIFYGRELYGAVTTATVAAEKAKEQAEVERLLRESKRHDSPTPKSKAAKVFFPSTASTSSLAGADDDVVQIQQLGNRPRTHSSEGTRARTLSDAVRPATAPPKLYADYQNNCGLAFDTTICQASFCISIGRMQFNERVNVTIRCQAILKQPEEIKINKKTGIAESKYATNDTVASTVEFLVLTVTPTQTSRSARNIRTKVLKLDLPTVFHLCPVIQRQNLLEGHSVADGRKVLRELAQLMRYDFTSNAGPRLRFHGLPEGKLYSGEKLMDATWPHELLQSKNDSAIPVQRVFRGYRVRSNSKKAQIIKARLEAAALNIQRVAKGALTRRRLSAIIPSLNHTTLDDIEPMIHYTTTKEEENFETSISACPSTDTVSTVEDCEVPTNQIEAVLSKTQVRVNGQFFDSTEKTVESGSAVTQAQSWELVVVAVTDVESGMRSEVSLTPSNMIFEACRKEWLENANVGEMTPARNRPSVHYDSFSEAQRKKELVMLEKEFLYLLVKYLNLFIAREKRVMVLKLNYDMV